MMTSTPLNIPAWQAVCKNVSEQAARTCGCLESLFQRHFTQGIDTEIEKLPESQRTEAVIIAREEFGYLTATEIERLGDTYLADGFCVHGIDADCCPLGCGDL